MKLIETDLTVPDDIMEFKDVRYKQIDSLNLTLSIYHSKELKGKAPLIVFVHGGAWKKGDKDDYLPYLISYAKKGYVTATIQYRLSGTAKYPAQLLDVQSAVKWLKEHAEHYHIDPKKVAMVGGSAGGHLVMMNAYTTNSQSLGENGFSSNVQAIVNFYGPSDLVHEEARDKPPVEYLMGKTFEEAPEAYKRASPIYAVTEAAPPTITFHGTLDELVPYGQSDRLHEKLKEKGVPSYYHKLKGWPHTMDMSVKVNAFCQYQMDRFFEKYIPKH
ncbi:alpha/beta hydrolase fold domain-containing protein [Maribacter sp. 2307ULW6-5]|uniref:alpha/beta hydrolase fold domain-containing protein n=1 Tax=Maribacter sp. 2307ULW6-5 TaxID=3386275 RepID=UPI0039BCC782